MKFQSLGLAEPILRAVLEEGYQRPTSIQSLAIPPLLAGDDVVGIAQTGTGKTAAFVLPLLQRFYQDNVDGKPQAGPRRCGALILTPTRELAAQIAGNIRVYGKYLKPSVALVVGGVKPRPQIRALAAGADILVATPGRLLDHMGEGLIKLDRTGFLVLDEADQMMDLGFLPSVRQIISTIPQERQTVMTSATMPQQIRKLANDFLKDAKEVSAAPQAQPIALIEQSVRHLPAAEKLSVLTEILSEKAVERTIVFTRTKRGADKVCKHLLSLGFSGDVIHGDKTQAQRRQTLYAFKAGETKILVATDLAARGIDVDNVSHVINFDLPQVAQSYVHRIGRTARAGQSGIAITLCAPSEKGLLKDIERLIGERIFRDNAGKGKRKFKEEEVKIKKKRSQKRPKKGQAARRRDAKAKQPQVDKGKEKVLDPVLAKLVA